MGYACKHDTLGYVSVYIRTDTLYLYTMKISKLTSLWGRVLNEKTLLSFVSDTNAKKNKEATIKGKNILIKDAILLN